MIRYSIVLSFFCISLYAMEQELPSRINGIKSDEVEYNYLLETKLINFFNVKFGINFDRASDNDPVIARLVKTAINRAFVLQDSAIKKRFCKLYNNPKTALNAPDLVVVDERIATEAARSILAERHLLTYIMKGHYNQPWVVRPEFDQELKAIRIKLGLNVTHKMENPRIIAILNPAQATWQSRPQPTPVKLPVVNRPTHSNYWPSSSPEYDRYATRSIPAYNPPYTDHNSFSYLSAY